MFAGAQANWARAHQLNSTALWCGWRFLRSSLILLPIVDGKHFGKRILLLPFSLVA
jgi:hypothetical protein